METKENMKKVIVGIALVALSLGPVAQADDSKANKKNAVSGKAKTECTDKAGVSCAEKTSASCTEKVSANCTEKKTFTSAQTACGTECCEKNKVARKTVKTPEKGAMLLANR